MQRIKTIQIERYPNLKTVIMVEKILEKNQDIPLKLSQLKNKLPKQIMHQTLKIILHYLWESGKIIYGPKGIQWIYTKPEQLKRLKQGSLEI